MHDIPIDELRYPVGKFTTKRPIGMDQIATFIDDMEKLPAQLKEAVEGWSDEQLDTPYRPGGWTVRQVIHHLADSHMNSYTRFKLALTEDKPMIKPYKEDIWAEQIDAKTLPVSVSLQLLEALHTRWVVLLKSLDEEGLNKTFVHPEHGKEVPLDINVAIYSWHSRHHLAHITTLKQYKNW